MGKQRYINTHFWDDNYIVDLDPIEKLLFLYLLTNPLTNIAGAYEIALRRIHFDTGIDKELIFKILGRFENDKKIIYREGWILILNFIKNQSVNTNMQKGIEDVIASCPDWIKETLGKASKAFPSVSNPSNNLNRDLNLNSNLNKNGGGGNKNARANENPPPPPVNSQNGSKNKTEQKLDALQAKYLHLEVRRVREKYLAFCKKNNKEPKWEIFESQWLEKEFEPMDADESPPDKPKLSLIEQCAECDSRGFITVERGGKDYEAKCKHPALQEKNE